MAAEQENVLDEFRGVVNMAPRELEEWLETDVLQKVNTVVRLRRIARLRIRPSHRGLAPDQRRREGQTKNLSAAFLSRWNTPARTE